MNMTPIIRQLVEADFKKMLATCRSQRERFPVEIARLDPSFEYHIDLPAEEQRVSQSASRQVSEKPGADPLAAQSRRPADSPLSDMPGWLADGKRFPND